MLCHRSWGPYDPESCLLNLQAKVYIVERDLKLSLVETMNRVERGAAT
jgi:hypothetical protein